MFVIIMIALVAILISTEKKNGRWGINTNNVLCPKCGMPMPKIRKPQNWRQFLWGGGTCNGCGCEVDKWGKEITRKS